MGIKCIKNSRTVCIYNYINNLKRYKKTSKVQKDIFSFLRTVCVKNMCKNKEQHAYKVYEIIRSSIIEFVSGLRTVYR